MSTNPSSSRTIIAILVVAALAIAFWMLLLSPKRQKESDLNGEVESQRISLSQAQSEVSQALTAKHEFASDYRQLVVLGKAVPASDETASLLVELNHVADHAGVKFESLQLIAGEAGETSALPTTQEASATAAVPTSSTVPPTEAEAALLPLGASIGSAGLGVMPYNLTFTGSFFQMADFIHGIDSLVATKNAEVAVDGRLVTLDGFALTESAEGKFPQLNASFTVTTYLVPPTQGLTAGATEEAPAEVAPAATSTTTGTPSSSVVAR